MKRLPFFAIVFALSGLSISLTAQIEPGTFQLGVGGGFNRLRYMEKSGNYEGWIFKSNTRIDVNRNGNSVGFHGNGTASYQLSRRWQIQSGIGISYAETHATVRSISVYGDSWFGSAGVSTSFDIVDEKFVLMDIPIYLRWHIRPKSGARDVGNFFIDAGAIFEFPIVNKSNFAHSKDGEPSTSEKLSINSASPLFAIGIAIGDNDAITLGWSLINIDQIDNSGLVRLSFTHFFTVSE